MPRLTNGSAALCAVIVLLTAHSCLAAESNVKTKPLRNASEVVEGSGDGLKGRLADVEVHGSGYPTDDEDGDDVQGSDSGAPEIAKAPANIPTATTTTRTPTTTTHSFKPVPVKPVAKVDHQKELTVDEDEDQDFDDDDEDDDENEEEPTTTFKPPTFVVQLTTTTPRTFKSLPTTPSSGVVTTERNGPFSPFHETMTRGIFAALAGGVIVAVITVILLVLFVVFRLRKKDEGSYALDEPKPRPYVGYAYTKASTKEFYA